MPGLLLTGFTLSVAQTAAKTHITSYDDGPDGLEAWTDDHHTQQFRKKTEPFGIVIARHGKMIRYIGHKDGGPFFWKLILLPDGKRIAYQAGDFHMSETCTLMDINTGKHLQDVSCFSEKDFAALPQWANDLLDSDREPPPDFRPPFVSGVRSNR